ncbi:unnamed protein product [Rotaria sp. Silwood2]|nr:unnamed protein product [Rotaria sp. Silwood2]CAF3457392.1 unnamed protein product [Rotaria sp. Silwood2]CAF4529819.1 unnamed protein product [Rotaria sp. Silwood2]CAF4608169.1 unnamed protein product [Rotaria sp. Silwood2]
MESPLLIEGIIDEIIIETLINHSQDKESVRNFKRSNEYINGLEHRKVYLNENLMIKESHCVRLTSRNSYVYNGFRTIEFTDEFSPESVIALQISLLPQIHQSVIDLREFLCQYSNSPSQFNQIIKK